jgi:molybdopterin-guanine dinucleotide biosynthesis protein A
MGRPKAWLPFGGEPMLARVVGVLRGMVGPVVVVAAPGQEVPPLPGDVEVVRDEEEGRGPLAGLRAGLRALAGRVDAAYLSSCDVPFLRPAFVRRVLDLLGDQAICVPLVGGYHHPLAAVYRVAAAEAADRLLAEGRARPVFLFECLPTREVTATELAEVDPDLASLRNLNTPGEYERALADLAGSGPEQGREAGEVVE